MTGNNRMIDKCIIKAAILLLSSFVLFGFVKMTKNFNTTPWIIIYGVLLILTIITYVFFVYWMMEAAILLDKNKHLWMALSIIFHVFVLGYFLLIMLNQKNREDSVRVSGDNSTDMICQHCGTVVTLESIACSSCGRPI